MTRTLVVVSALALAGCMQVGGGPVNEMGLEVDGLLGLNVLESFKVGLDFERNVLTLSEP